MAKRKKKRRTWMWRLRWCGKLALNTALGPAGAGALRLARRGNPDWMSDAAGRLMRMVGPLLPEHRIGRANLAAAFPDKSTAEIERILSGVWDNLGRVGIEFAHLDRLWHYDPDHPERSRVEFTPDTAERFNRLRDDGEPALIFAAHLANWELPAVAAAVHGVKTAVLYRRPNIGNIDQAIQRLRAVNMGRLIPTEFGAPLQAAEALARGEHVAMLVDQYERKGVEVTFFGRSTRANPLIARLAQHVDCPIHGVRMIRLPNHRFRCDLAEAIQPVRDADGSIDVKATMQAITTVVESWVREYPEQWLWLHRRWR